MSPAGQPERVVAQELPRRRRVIRAPHGEQFAADLHHAECPANVNGFGNAAEMVVVSPNGR